MNIVFFFFDKKNMNIVFLCTPTLPKSYLLFLVDSKVLSCMADGCSFISKEVGINFLVFKRFMYTQSLCESDKLYQ